MGGIGEFGAGNSVYYESDDVSYCWRQAVAVVEKLEEKNNEEKLAELRRRAQPFRWLIEFLEGENGRQAKELLRAAGKLNEIGAFRYGIPNCITLMLESDGEQIQLTPSGLMHYERDYSPLSPRESRALPKFEEYELSALEAAALLAEKQSVFSKDALVRTLDEIAQEIKERCTISSPGT